MTRSNGRVYQVGIVSFGREACGMKTGIVPDVYTRVTGFLDWIETNTRDAKWCPGPSTPAFTGRNSESPGYSQFGPPQMQPAEKKEETTNRIFKIPSVNGQPAFSVVVPIRMIEKDGPTRLTVLVNGQRIVLVIPKGY